MAVNFSVPSYFHLEFSITELIELLNFENEWYTSLQNGSMQMWNSKKLGIQTNQPLINT